MLHKPDPPTWSDVAIWAEFGLLATVQLVAFVLVWF